MPHFAHAPNQPASAADQSGSSAQGFVSITVADKQADLAQVSVLNKVTVSNFVPFVYNISQVEAQQIAADTAVTRALSVVKGAKAVVAAQQAEQGRAQLALNLAVSQENAAEVTFTKANDIFCQAENTLHRQEAVLNTAKNILAVAQTALKNANAVLAAAQENLAKAQATFDKTSAAFQAATDAYTKALQELTQSQANYNRAVAAVKDAQNAYNIAWNNVQNAKAELDDANNKLQEANAKVTNTQNQVDLATQANDDAHTALNVADAALTAAQHTLEDANKAVSDLRGEANSAKSALGSAKFNLNQALSNLYVAQAAKEAADKATAIAYAQGFSSTDILNGESTYVFNGCLNQVYPAISGTVSVVKLIPSGCQLSSGHVLTWGDCTTKDNVNIGDLIYYEGSLVGNSISATHVKKQ